MTPYPYFSDVVFEPNPDAKVGRIQVDGLVSMFIIDDFYRHPEIIHEMLQNSWVHAWKWEPNSKNFVDYYDCRHVIKKIDYPDRSFSSPYSRLWSIIAENMGYVCENVEPDYEFNFFKWINVPGQNIQSYPHQDSRIEDPRIAGLIYLNKDEDCNGGTAFYHDNAVNPDVGVMEKHDIQVDVDKHYNIAGLVESKFNRCIIYPGWWMHGAYIEDHNFYTDKWRINQVFFEKVKA